MGSFELLGTTLTALHGFCEMAKSDVSATAHEPFNQLVRIAPPYVTARASEL